MRILIADDHELLRDVLRAYLEAEGGFAVDLVADLPAALERITAEAPYDLVVLDYGMPGMDGYDGLEKAIAADKVLALGAAGYLPKTLPARSLVNAIRFMAAGEVYMPLDLHRPSQAAVPQPSGLSPREVEVLARLCSGQANKEIARELNLREPTIKLHVKTICRKLAAKNRTHAAMIARERALC